MPRTLDPLPPHWPIVDRIGTITDLFRLRWQALIDGFSQVPSLATFARLALGAALPTTTLWTTLAAGTYRITVYVRITQAATTSSSLTVTVGWVEKDTGFAATKSFPALTGNTTGTVETLVIDVPATTASNLTIATAYASVGAQPMLSRIDASVEQIV